MNRSEVTVRWTVHAASERQARAEAEILAKQGNHRRHGVDGGEVVTVVTVAPLRDVPPPAPAPRGDR